MLLPRGQADVPLRLAACGHRGRGDPGQVPTLLPLGAVCTQMAGDPVPPESHP